jgi:uncharacterized membrane protein
MVKLNQQLQQWVDAQLLSSEQADRIVDFEAAKPSRHWALYGMLVVGVTVLVIGVISMIAANWNELSRFQKLGADLFILTLLAYGIFKLHQEEKTLLFEIGLILYSGLVLASIGLISQVYHTGGDLYQALVFWLVLHLPLLFTTQRAPLPHVWLMIFMATIVTLLYEFGSLLFGIGEDHTILAALFCAPITLGLMSRLSKKFLPQHAFAKVCRFWAALGALITVISIDIYICNGINLTEIQPVLMIIALFSALSLIATFTEQTLSNFQKKAITALILVYVTGVVLVSFNIENSLLGAAVSIAFGSASALYFGVFEHRKLFNFFALLITLRFLVVYFEAMGGLALTGVGLIVSGVIIMSIGLFWYKKRTHIQAYMSEIK